MHPEEEKKGDVSWLSRLSFPGLPGSFGRGSHDSLGGGESSRDLDLARINPC